MATTSQEGTSSSVVTEEEPAHKRLKSNTVGIGTDSDVDNHQKQPQQQLPPPERWFLFDPSNFPYTYRDGESIVCLRSSRDTTPVQAIFCKAKALKEDSSIRFMGATSDDGKEANPAEPLLVKKKKVKLVLPNFFCRELTSETASRLTILMTPETKFFRQLVYCVHASDRVLEIGCSTGETSKLLYPLCQSLVALDTSQEMLDKCWAEITQNNQHTHATADKNLHLAKVDSLIDPSKAMVESTKFGNPTVVFIDIGGNRESLPVQRMLSWILSSFSDGKNSKNDNNSLRLVVVKSRELVQMARKTADIDKQSRELLHGPDWFRRHVRQGQPERKLPKHPLKAPYVMAPTSPNSSSKEAIPICRYHNYHKNGCSKLKNGNKCPLDHEHCHACLGVGHIARNCPTMVQQNGS